MRRSPDSKGPGFFFARDPEGLLGHVPAIGTSLLVPAVELVSSTSCGRKMDARTFDSTHIFVHMADPGWRAVACLVSYTAVRLVLVWRLYRKRVFVKVQFARA
jgi:hypothetical protein